MERLSIDIVSARIAAMTYHGYQALARKWRPHDFSTLSGQEHVVKALTHALDQRRLHHAWLFTGTRGIGKTTLSRILAKALNCIGADGHGQITSQPCGVCMPCQAIDAGRFVDYVEMDAASNRGVDEMAQLLEKAVYAPSMARFKIYMIDEVHMLTNHAFNAMLKTLEEPPEHIKFILATTDPQKIPATVLSRCLQFNLKQIPPAHIVTYLSKVLEAEDISFDPNALPLLARAAQGSMRDALTLTDQAIAYGNNTLSEATVQDMLGVLDQRYLIRVVDSLIAQDGSLLISIADEMLARSLSFSAALQDLASLLHKIALAQAIPQAVPDAWPEAEDIRRLAQELDAQEVQLFYQIANQGRQQLSLAPDDYAGFTMTLLRMLAFRPRFLSEDRPHNSHIKSVDVHQNIQHAKEEKEEQGIARSAHQANTGIIEKILPPTTDSVTQKAVAPPLASLPSPQSWPNFAARIPLRGLVKQLAHQSELTQSEVSDTGVTLYLRVPVAQMTDPALVQRFEKALSEQFKKTTKLVLSVGTVSISAAAADADVRSAQQQAAEQAVAENPFVQSLVNDFGMTVVPGSIRPRT